MCHICLQIPCRNGCPNHPEPKAVAFCENCGEPLYAGDKVFEGVCESCLKEFSVSDWLELLGETFEELEEAEWEI